jgi:poly-gamma-glutamate system protein
VAGQLLSGRLIGEEYTPLTTTLGSYQAKRLSLNPDFAALAADLFIKAGVRRGGAVAVNFSGSFPALNIAVLAAIDAIGARPVIASSLGASTWGANRLDDTWLDIEGALVANGLWRWRTAAVFIGGEGDVGKGMELEGLAAVSRAAVRAGLVERRPVSLQDAIEQRMIVYQETNHALPDVLVNVGGSHVIFGEQGHFAALRQGLTPGGYRPGIWAVGGLAGEFLRRGKPVVHFINIRRLAEEYGINETAGSGGSRALGKAALPGHVRAGAALWLVFVFCLLRTGGQRGWRINAPRKGDPTRS